jgi:predicted RNase H-like nuclease (RuvC/YqgF family)
MSIFKAMESIVENLKVNLKEYAETHETQRQDIKYETKEDLLKVYKVNATNENIVELHAELMKRWNEIDLLVSNPPKFVESQDMEKIWEIYPLNTLYLKWAFAANVEYEIRVWDTVGLEDCIHNKIFQDYMECGNLKLGEKILLVKIN